MAPLIKAGGREDYPPIPETVGKGFLLCRRLRASVDNQLVILVSRKAEASRDSDDLSLLINDRRDYIARKDFTGLILSRIVLLHVLVDRIKLFILADTGKVVRSKALPS